MAETFKIGVCDYSKPLVDYARTTPWLTYSAASTEAGAGAAFDRGVMLPGGSSQLSLARLVPCRQPEARGPHPSSLRSACPSQSRECTTPSAFLLSCLWRPTIPCRYTCVRP